MNKFGLVLGVAAVATLAGCKDPDYKRSGSTATQNEVKNIDTTLAATPAPTVGRANGNGSVASRPIAIEPVAVAPKCNCLPGTKHTKPCTCGAPDCQCIVETRPVVVADLSKPAVGAAGVGAAAESTVYIVQNGDYLAKISKKFNVTLASLRRLNPTVKNDLIRVGQKLNIPGKVDVGVQSAPVTVAAAAPAVKKVYTPYVGATKEYVVKSGDTLSAIAYGNGINVRQLKELNGLSSDALKIGQKLKIPAEKVVKAAKPANVKVAAPVVVKKVEAPKPVAAAPVVEKVEPAVVEAVPVVEGSAAAEVAAKAAVVQAAPAAKADAPATTTYVVQEGDDMTGVSIRWGVSAAEIRELNNLADGDQLVPGQIIKLPADAQQ